MEKTYICVLTEKQMGESMSFLCTEQEDMMTFVKNRVGYFFDTSTPRPSDEMIREVQEEAVSTLLQKGKWAYQEVCMEFELERHRLFGKGEIPPCKFEVISKRFLSI